VEIQNDHYPRNFYNSDMGLYYIVKKGGPPGGLGAANLGGVCVSWAQSTDKDQTEVIAVSATGGVIIRFTAAQSERLARDFLKPIFPT